MGAFVLRAVPLAVALAVLAGCGGGSSGGTAASAAPLPVLPVSAVRGLPASTHDLEAHQLAADAGKGSALEQDLARWGFQRGRERVFQGESHTLSLVVSRTLEFGSPVGARAYVRFVAGHVGTLFGAGSAARGVEIGGRAGYLVSVAACACHMAQPAVAVVLGKGDRVTYLQLNGPAATPTAARRLADEAP